MVFIILCSIKDIKKNCRKKIELKKFISFIEISQKFLKSCEKVGA